MKKGVTGDVIKGDILNQIVVIETSEGRQLTISVAQMEVVERGKEQADEGEGESWGEDLDFAALAEMGGR